jgi:hypothetical protein
VGHRALGQPRLHGHHPPREHHLPEQLHDDRHLVDLVGHRLLGQGEAETVPQRGQQMRPRGPLRLAPPQRLAIDGDALYGVRGSGWCRQQPLGPGASWAANAARSPPRKTAWRVAAQGDWRGKPKAGVRRAP